MSMYKRILIAVSPSPVSREAVREGVALAKVHGAEVLFFTVLPRYVVPVADMPMVGMPSPEAFQREAHRNAHRLLAAAKIVADRSGVTSHGAIGAGDDDAQCIAEAARKRRCGLIVAATASRSALMRLIGGSLIPGLISHATVPVLICRPPEAQARAARSAAKAPLAPGRAALPAKSSVKAPPKSAAGSKASPPRPVPRARRTAAV